MRDQERVAEASIRLALSQGITIRQVWELNAFSAEPVPRLKDEECRALAKRTPVAYREVRAAFPEWLPTLATFKDGDVDVTWYLKPKNKHLIEYGRQIKEFNGSFDASQEFVACIHHSLECAGKIDY